MQKQGNGVIRRAAVRALALAAVGAALAGCAETELAVHTAKTISGSAEGAGQVGKYKVGKPYAIQGKTYYPAEDYTYSEIGVASWYGPGFHGKRTANGEVFDMNALTAAHRTLPMPSMVRVTNLDNGRSIVLRVNDRGPFARDRILDVSRRAAQLLGFLKQGTAKVKVEILPEESMTLKAQAQAGRDIAMPRVKAVPRGKVETAGALSPATTNTADTGRGISLVSAAQAATGDAPMRAAERIAAMAPGTYVQAGAFSDLGNARRLQVQLSDVATVSLSPVTVNGRDLYRVRLGPVENADEAERVLAALRAKGISGARLVTD